MQICARSWDRNREASGRFLSFRTISGTGNKHSPTVICAAITSQMHKAKLPTHVELNCDKYDLAKDSVVLLEQLRTIDKKRLKDKVCHLDTITMEKVNRALEISLELT